MQIWNVEWHLSYLKGFKHEVWKTVKLFEHSIYRINEKHEDVDSCLDRSSMCLLPEICLGRNLKGLSTACVYRDRSVLNMDCNGANFIESDGGAFVCKGHEDCYDLREPQQWCRPPTLYSWT
ncbi:unnamed protein product [Dracunculus medinensis]|uniref:SRCR domain-containing protein n=1 Tax=Dracunculus medinensis TaxID=318479 RepID=A0A0N4U5S8_DRAME|nr:unnamed protein product [Dracunculus medinensis]